MNRAGILRGNSTIWYLKSWSLCSGSVPCKHSGLVGSFEPASCDTAVVPVTSAEAPGSGCSFASGAPSRSCAACLASVPSAAARAAASSSVSARTRFSCASSPSAPPAGADRNLARRRRKESLLGRIFVKLCYHVEKSYIVIWVLFYW